MCTCLTSLLTCFLSKKAHGALQLRVINNASELLIKTELLYARTVSLRDKTKPHIIQFNLLLVIHLAKQTQNLSERAKPYVGIAFIFVILKINYKPVNTCTLASNKLNRISLFETRNSYSMRQNSFWYCAVFQNTCSCSIFKVRIFYPTTLFWPIPGHS